MSKPFDKSENHLSMSQNPLSLDQLRSQIDEIDQLLLSTMIKRLDVAVHIAKAKAQNIKALNIKAADQKSQEISQVPVLFRPDREAILLRRLIGESKQLLSHDVIIKIWRELIGQSLQTQANLLGGLFIYGSRRDPYDAIDAAICTRFGAHFQAILVEDEKKLLERVKKTNHLGVLSMTARHGAWWARLLATPEINIVCGLKDQALVMPSVVIIAAQTPEPSGNDLSFWVTDADQDARKIDQALSGLGFAGELLMTSQGFGLWGIAGFVQATDPRLIDAPGRLQGIIGAMPLIDVAR